jgi:hypothetical protein
MTATYLQMPSLYGILNFGDVETPVVKFDLRVPADLTMENILLSPLLI